MPVTRETRKGAPVAPMSADDRRAELRRRKTTLQQIGDAVGGGVDFTLVSHVIAGRRLSSPHAPKIMTYIAGVLAVPVDIAFPEYQKGDSE